MIHTRIAFIATALAAAACSSEPAQPGEADARSLDAATGDAPRPIDARAVALPSWRLEDIQPMSPRVGQTYGLDTFSDKIVVVTLLEGF